LKNDGGGYFCWIRITFYILAVTSERAEGKYWFKSSKNFCPLCFTVRTNFSLRRAPLHFSNHKNPATKQQLNDFIESTKE
jgi:hypothetical protein